MRFVTRALERARSGLRAAFDGARESGTRSQVFAFGLDAKGQIQHWERRALRAKSRSLRDNLGLVGHLIHGTADYAIGEGLVPQPQSADKEWNRAALAYFDSVANHRNWNVDGASSFYEDQCLVLPELITDGEVFALKVLGDFGEQSQLILSDQVTGGGEGYDDGVVHNGLGRAMSYRVQLDKGARLVGRADMVHAYRRRRVQQQRGIPWLHHGVNSCIDILDLLAFEKVAAKLNSALIAAITTASGKLPGGMEHVVSSARTVPQGEQPKPDDGVKALNIFGSSVPVLKHTEKIEFFDGKRPSLTFAGFIDYLIRDIAWGMGVAPELVWAISGLTGANTRLIVELGDRYFRRVAGSLADSYAQPNWDWVISRACLSGRLPWPRDPSARAWALVKWRGPRAMTVDRGRDGRLYIELVKNRMMTLEEWWTTQGEDPVAQRRAWIDELAEDLQYCAEKGIPPQVYLNSQPGQLPDVSGDSSAETARALLQMMRDDGLV